MGFLGLGVGLSKIPVFLHGVVLSVLPGTIARLIVSVTISAGAAATALGLLVFGLLYFKRMERTFGDAL